MIIEKTAEKEQVIFNNLREKRMRQYEESQQRNKNL